MSVHAVLLRPLGEKPLMENDMELYPCIMLDGRAEEALNYYSAFLPEARATEVLRADGSAQGAEGALIAATLAFRGGRLMLLNGHPAPSSHAVSLFVPCETQAEVDRLWAAIEDGGKPVACGWITDRYGVAWQIVPKGLLRLLGDPDAGRAARAMRSMMGMVKIDLHEIERAANSD